MTLIGVTSAAGADARRDGRSADRGPWAGPAATTSAEGRAQFLGAYASLPLAFVENRGQTHARVRFQAQGARYGFALTREGVVLSLVKGAGRARGVNLALRFLGAIPASGCRRGAADRDGQRPPRKRPGALADRAARHAEVVYRDLWPGIDLSCAGGPGR